MERTGRIHETLWGPVDEDGNRVDLVARQAMKAFRFVEMYGGPRLQKYARTLPAAKLIDLEQRFFATWPGAAKLSAIRPNSVDYETLWGPVDINGNRVRELPRGR